MNVQDTIAAISSSVGAAARMIVRVSGDQAGRVGGELAEIWEARPGRAILATIWPGAKGWVYWFAGPRSYTGEDLVEFHIPGSPVLARMLLDEVVRRGGARQAEPGEFTARAYFNGQMDLTQAEGVAATIAAHSERELRAARQLMGGELTKRLSPVMESVAEALALVEAGIDFSDEGVSFMSGEEVKRRCEEAGRALRVILDESARFERLSHEPRIVLVGRPNAGKSTLLNALAGRERAVVSNVAGTTRDAIWAEVRLARGMVRVVDVAGLEEPSAGEIERQMQEQARREVATADIVVSVEDCSVDDSGIALAREVDLRVVSKSDLLEGEVRADKNVCPTVMVSAKTGEGLDELKNHMDELAFGPHSAGVGMALNARHVRALGEAIEALERAGAGAEAGAEVMAMELREALDVLGSVLGRMSPDDLLGRIFSQFCIGK